jgi:hypothetical protein
LTEGQIKNRQLGWSGEVVRGREEKEGYYGSLFNFLALRAWRGLPDERLYMIGGKV